MGVDVDDKIRAGAEFVRVGQAVDPAAAAAPAPRGWEWGAASLALGAVLALLAVLALQLAYQLETSGFRGFSRSDQRLAALGGYGGALCCLLLAGTAAGFGIAGIAASRREGRPVALGLAGVLLGGLDLFLWLGALVAWHSSAWNML
jgi:hypothetical protein